MLEREWGCCRAAPRVLCPCVCISGDNNSTRHMDIEHMVGYCARDASGGGPRANVLCSRGIFYKCITVAFGFCCN